MYFKDDTSDDPSELNEEPRPLKVHRRKVAKIYNPYISFRSLSDATGHFKKTLLQENMQQYVLILQFYMASK